MTMVRPNTFGGMGTPHLKYSPLPGRIDPPVSVRLSGNATLLHPRPQEGKAVPTVKIGDSVKTGQRIALYGDGDCVTAPVTGTVASLTFFPGSFGQSYTALALAPASDEAFDDGFHSLHATPSLAALDFLNAAPGAPGLQRLTDAERPVRTLVVSGLDQDILVFTQQYALDRRSSDIQHGIQVLKQLTGIEEVIVLCRKEAVQGFGGTIGRVIGVDSRYPSALPPLVMARIFGRVVPAGQPCEDLGFCFMNAEAVAAIGAAFRTGRVPVAKLLTVQLKNGTTRLAEAWIGTPVGDVLQQLGETLAAEDRIVLGGPMRGTAVFSPDHPVQPDTDALLVVGADAAAQPSSYPCINCGECVRICPARMQINLLVRYLEAGQYADAEESYDLDACVECGLCSYVCVSQIPILQYIVLAKHELARQRRTENPHA